MGSSFDFFSSEEWMDGWMDVRIGIGVVWGCEGEEEGDG